MAKRGKYKYPSVTKIINSTKPKKDRESLDLWRLSVGEITADAIIQAAFKRGRELDNCVQQYIKKRRSSEPRLDRFLDQYNIHSVEQKVISEKYKYEGRYDAILEKDGVFYINDFKTSRKPKKKDYIEDYKLQIGAYYGALLEIGAPITKGIIAVFPDGVDEVQEFVFVEAEMKQFYKRFLNRVKEYYYGQEI